MGSSTWRVGILVALVLASAGCSAFTPPPYAELSAPQTDQDLMPDGLADELAVDAGSVRLAGEHEGNTFYLAKSTDMRDGVCIIVDAPGAGGSDSQAAGCSVGNATTTLSLGSVRYGGPTGIPDSAVQDGWVRISANLLFRPGV